MQNKLIPYQKKQVIEFSNNYESIEPLVSIITLTYNHKNYLERCLDSLLKQQTNFDFEILLGDDASTDGTREICSEYAKKYPKVIRLFLHERANNIAIDGRPTGRFNYIYNFTKARGKYIAVCEGDDFWIEADKLQQQVDLLERNKDISLCFTRAHLLKGNKKFEHQVPEQFLNSAFHYVELLKYHNFIATASVMFRKPEEFHIPEWFYKITFGDLGLYKLISRNKMIYCMDEVMCAYRVHDRGIYSRLDEFAANQNYALFYKIIMPILNADEKLVAKSKLKLTLYKMSKLKFPKHKIQRKFYNVYLRLKYKNL